MADIQTLMKQLLSAVYGKDVRQAIHDAIEQCYVDGKAGSIDLTARQKIDDLAADVLEIQETGATAEVIEAKVQSVINELIADGTMSGMTLADGSVTLAKLADDVLTSLAVSAVYDETTGDLYFSASEALKSAYPVGIENATLNADHIRNASTGELEEDSTLKTVSDWFVLPEGVYKSEQMWVNDGTSANYGNILFDVFEADKSTGEFKRKYANEKKYNNCAYITARADRIYSLQAPTEGFTDRIVAKNQKDDSIKSVVLDLAEIIDSEICTYPNDGTRGLIDVTEYIPYESVGNVSKFKVNNFANEDTFIGFAGTSSWVGNNQAVLYASSTDSKVYISLVHPDIGTQAYATYHSMKELILGKKTTIEIA